MSINYYEAGLKWAEGGEFTDSEVAWENWRESIYNFLKLPERGSDEFVVAAEEFSEGFVDGLSLDENGEEIIPDGIESAKKSLVVLQNSSNAATTAMEIGFIVEMFGSITTHYVQGGEPKESYEAMRKILLDAVAAIDAL